MNHSAAKTSDQSSLESQQEQGSLRRSCLVCRVIGLVIALISAAFLVFSGVTSLNIGLFAAFLLLWALGGGLTLVILSISAMRRTPASESGSAS